MAHSSYQSLADSFKRINKLDHAMTILNWDQMVMMPKNGVSARSETLAELSVMRHELLTSTEVAEQITACEDDAESLNDGERRSIKAIRMAYDDVS